MKRYIKLIALFFLLSPCVACATPVSVKLKVVNEQQQPIADVDVRMAFLLGKGKNSRSGMTDENGIVEVTDNAVFGVSMAARKEGYYTSMIRTGYGDQNVTLLLREKKNPIAMYAKKIHVQPVVFGKEFGYDLIEGDYVSPYGTGKVKDMVLKINYEEKDFFNKEYYLSVRFSNPDDGLYSFFIEHKESEYKSAHLAPSTSYKSEWDFKRISVKGSTDVTNFDRQRNYYFRVRTVVNEKGEIESAHYGKIYGEFPRITYYINPTPNDRNVEFDMRKNLFRNLKNEERPRAP